MFVDRWQRNLKSNEALRVLVLAADRTSIFLPLFTRSLPPLLPIPRIHVITGWWCLVAALGPLGVRVPQEARRGVGGLFLIFVSVPTAFVFFGLQTLCFLVFGGWWNFVYWLLENLSFTTVSSRFEINSFDTASN